VYSSRSSRTDCFAEDDVLVLRRVHLPAKVVRGFPQPHLLPPPFLSTNDFAARRSTRRSANSGSTFGRQRLGRIVAVGDAARFAVLVDVEQAVVGGHVEGVVGGVDAQAVDVPDGAFVTGRWRGTVLLVGCTPTEEEGRDQQADGEGSSHESHSSLAPDPVAGRSGLPATGRVETGIRSR